MAIMILEMEMTILNTPVIMVLVMTISLFPSPLMLDCQDSEQEVTSSLGRLEAGQEEESCL